MKHKTLIAASFALITGCTATTEAPNERSDRWSFINAKSVSAPAKPTKHPAWQPGGPGDTDGKPGEPNCPDCDGGGPVYHGSVRPSR